MLEYCDNILAQNVILFGILCYSCHSEFVYIRSSFSLHKNAHFAKFSILSIAAPIPQCVNCKESFFIENTDVTGETQEAIGCWFHTASRTTNAKCCVFML